MARTAKRAASGRLDGGAATQRKTRTKADTKKSNGAKAHGAARRGENAKGGEPRKTKGGPDAVDRHVGQRVRLRRMVQGMSQQLLAQSLGLTFQQIQKYEKGVNRIGAGRLYEMAGVLDVPVTFFYDGLNGMIGATGFSEDGPARPDGSEGPDVLGLVNSPEGVELNRHFAAIDDPNLRKRVIELVRSIAESDRLSAG